jgi:cytoskeleton protein RodZ
VDIGIGETLREARNRRKVDLSEVEAATRIRIRYLRAIEAEEWDVLPGDVYVRGFIRTYASYLGLDGDRLADDYRRGVSALEKGPQGADSVTALRQPGHSRSPFRGRAVAVAVVLGLIGLVVGVGLLTGEDDPAVVMVEDSRPERSASVAGKASAPDGPAFSSQPGIALELAATAEVWVCVLDGRGEPLVDGLILSEGAEEGPFRSGSFTVSFGNGEVSMRIDGKEAEIPATSSPVGYAIGEDGGLEPLDDGERPTCL